MVEMITSLSSDISVFEAGTTSSFGAIMTSREIEMILIDEHFMDIGGLALLEQVSHFGTVPITVLMAETFDEELIAKAVKHGVYDCVRLPVAQSEIERLLKRLEALHKQLSVLIVDQKPPARKIIYKLLQESSFKMNISEAESGTLAISLCRSIPYQILFVDPDTEGWQGADTVRKIIHRQPWCRIILMSPNSKSDLLPSYDKSGLSGFLKKPFYPRDLDHLMHGLLEIPRQNLNNRHALIDKVEADPVQTCDRPSGEIVWL